MTVFLSDELKTTRDRLKDCRFTGLCLDPEQVESFVKRFNTFVELAIDLENDLSMNCWNLAAKREEIRRITAGERIVQAELERPGSNVVAVPARSREGGAA